MIFRVPLFLYNVCRMIFFLFIKKSVGLIRVENHNRTIKDKHVSFKLVIS